MRLVFASRTFQRAYLKLTKRNLDLRTRIDQAIEKLAADAFDPQLKTHKLQGNLAASWACSVDYSYRIIFEFANNSENGEEEILLSDVGTHNEVY